MMQVRQVKRREVKDFIESHHYSRNINGLKVSFCYGLFVDGHMVGACVFGMLSTTAWKRYGESEGDVLELRRLVLHPSYTLPPNSLSSFVSKCIKDIKGNSAYKVVVSYADPHHGHHGGIYQALSFLYLGTTAKDVVLRDIETGKRYHSRSMRVKYKGELKPFAIKLRQRWEAGLIEEVTVPGKHIYVFPLKKSNRKRFTRLALPYPTSSTEGKR